MRGILLDLDGTLIDSNEAHARAWLEALADAGVPADYAEVRERIGEGGDRLLPGVTGIDPESELGKRLLERRGELFRMDYLPRIRALPGARALIELFHARGYRTVVTTSGTRRDTELLLRQTQLDDLLTELATGDDADSTKPAPDVVSAALGVLGIPARDAILLGDTPYDIEAARRANVPAVAFTCGGWSPDRLSGAVAVYQGPWELLAAFDRSVFASPRVAA
jgi:phosphoglycolate phosphatase-like HAD superfamily hydrolase